MPISREFNDFVKALQIIQAALWQQKIFGYAVFSFTFIITSTTKKYMDDTFFDKDKCYQFT